MCFWIFYFIFYLGCFSVNAVYYCKLNGIRHSRWKGITEKCFKWNELYRNAFRHREGASLISQPMHWAFIQKKNFGTLSLFLNISPIQDPGNNCCISFSSTICAEISFQTVAWVRMIAQSREVYTLLSIFGKRGKIKSDARLTTLGWLDDRLRHVYTQWEWWILPSKIDPVAR